MPATPQGKTSRPPPHVFYGPKDPNTGEMLPEPIYDPRDPKNEFPRAMYHPSEDSVDVDTADERDRLLKEGWSLAPCGRSHAPSQDELKQYAREDREAEQAEIAEAAAAAASASRRR